MLPDGWGEHGVPVIKPTSLVKAQLADGAKNVVHVAYTKGLHELGDGLYAYLQPDGGWGWSNAGLVTAGGTSLLVDTLYDLRLTREMLDAMAPVTADHPIDAAMNTHANPDHCLGNELLPADHRDLLRRRSPPTRWRGCRRSSCTPSSRPSCLRTCAPSSQWRSGPFDVADVTVRPPSQTFSGRLELAIGDRPT